MQISGDVVILQEVRPQTVEMHKNVSGDQEDIGSSTSKIEKLEEKQSKMKKSTC